jgi:hypothetical protein
MNTGSTDGISLKIRNIRVNPCPDKQLLLFGNNFMTKGRKEQRLFVRAAAAFF